jgi:hypothetical protein
MNEGIGGMANAGNGIGEGMAARDRHGIGRRPWGNDGGGQWNGPKELLSGT